MNPLVTTAASTACRGVCLATTSFTLTVSFPVVAATLAITALTGLAVLTLSRPRSSVQISHDKTSIEFRRD